jgi:hypothetical protein
MIRRVFRGVAGAALVRAAIVAAVVVGVSFISRSAQASPIFSQTPASDLNALASDRGFDASGHEQADNVTLVAPDTARSVTWRGTFAFSRTPQFPLSLDLIFYGNGAGNLPNVNDILSSTTVSFASTNDFTDTGIDVAGFNVYEFRANLTPTALPAGTPVWFSVLGDSRADADDNFYWIDGNDAGDTAERGDVAGNGPFIARTYGPFYFILDNAPIPEPASLGTLALATGALVLRRRRC